MSNFEVNHKAWIQRDGPPNYELWEVWWHMTGVWVVDNNGSDNTILPKNWFIQTRTASHIGR